MKKNIRRSMLFVPASSEKMMYKAGLLECDAVIYDLEDSVSFSQKTSAREMLVGYLSEERPENKEIVVRINGMDSFLGITDLYELLPCNIDTFLIPKATPEVLLAADVIITAYERDLRLEPDVIGMIALVETAYGIQTIDGIAGVAKRMTGMQLGAEDLTKDLGIQRTAAGDELWYARNVLSCAAHSRNMDAIDTPFTDYRDAQAHEEEAWLAKSVGMTGKTAIHPAQIEVINKIFSPSEQEILEAQEIVNAYGKAVIEGKGAVGVNGRMVDAPIAERAQQLLDKAEEIRNRIFTPAYCQ